MLWTVLTACFIIFVSVVGITELLRLVWLHWMRPKEDPPRILVVFLKEGIALQQLRSAVEYVSWEGQCFFGKIALIDDALSGKEKNQIMRAIEDLPMVLVGQEALQREVSLKR